ncbi:hypothetical protein [Allokutzneria sp. NRRL B-24872]|uniref:POT-type proton-dependent oligopeptide transporter n=1 Tax=Allokutzneria sp. NRRL B-24872 TaxID=1137961 RepID=UPI00352E0453
MLWTRLGARQPGTPRKFAGAVLLAGLSFVLLALAAYLDSDGKVSPLWLVGTYVLLAVGELMLAPVGLSATTKLAPAAFSSQIMGLWFLAGAAGNGIGILVTQLYSDETELAYFGVLGLCAIATAVLLYFAAPRIRVLMQGVH